MRGKWESENSLVRSAKCNYGDIVCWKRCFAGESNGWNTKYAVQCCRIAVVGDDRAVFAEGCSEFYVVTRGFRTGARNVLLLLFTMADGDIRI